MTASVRPEIPWTKLPAPLRSAMFLATFLLLVRFRVDPELVYHGVGQFLLYQIYVPGVTTVLDSPPVPGGVAEYAAAWIAQFSYWPWIGAMILTFLAGVLCLLTGRVLALLGGDDARWLRYVPAILLLMQYGRYYLYRTDGLTVSFALLLVYLLARAPRRRANARLVAFAVCGAAVYALASDGYLVFVLLLAIHEFFKARRATSGAICLLVGVVVPGLVGRLLFDLDLLASCRRGLPCHARPDAVGAVVTYAFHAFFPLAGLACVLWPTVRRKWAIADRRLPQVWRDGRLRRPVGTLALLLVTAGGLSLTLNHVTRARLRVDNFARQRMWEEALAEAKHLPAEYFDELVCHDVNRALFHTGRLADDMFCYPQLVKGLLIHPRRDLTLGALAQIRNYVKRSQTHYELGHLNRAEHDAHEALELARYNPTVLRQLAMIQIVKENPDAARVFLHALSKDLIHHEWADRRLRELDADPFLAADDEVRQIRSRMLPEGRGVGMTRADFFLPLLRQDKGNRMAFEYLMAFSLVTGYCDQAVACLGYLDDMGHAKGNLPRHYAEAVLLHEQISGTRVDLHGWRIDPMMTQRFKFFTLGLANARGDPVRAKKVLGELYGDTYYYFHWVRSLK